MINTGIITKIEKNRIYVHFYKDSACSHCSSCATKDKMGNIFKFDVSNPENYKLEQEVTIELEDSTFLKFSFITYILPAIAMILGYYIFNLIGFSEIFSIVGSFVFLFISFLFLFIYDKRKTKEISNTIKLIK